MRIDRLLLLGAAAMAFWAAGPSGFGAAPAGAQSITMPPNPPPSMPPPTFQRPGRVPSITPRAPRRPEFQRPRRPGRDVTVEIPLFIPRPTYIEPALPPEYVPPRRRAAPPPPSRRAAAPRRPRVAAPPPMPAPRPQVLADLVENRHEPDVVLIAVPGGSADALAQEIAATNGLTILERSSNALLDREIYRLRIEDGRPVATVLAALSLDTRVLVGQANTIFSTQQGAQALPPGLQYASEKLRLASAHQRARGRDVVVAVIDTGVDAEHDAFGAASIRRVSVLDGEHEPGDHGTQIAGLIAAQGALLGVAPSVEIVAIEAFSAPEPDAPAEATAYGLLKALDAAHGAKARVINMSFAGGRDPLFNEMLDALDAEGVVLVAAAGNNGPAARPAWPGAHAKAIAVTATDPRDSLYADANRGAHIALAAPGVDVVAPGAKGQYRIASGTSLAAAHITGAVALLLEKSPRLTPDQVRVTLTGTARDLGAEGADPEFGAGLADPLAALEALDTQAKPLLTSADGEAP